MSAVKLGDLPAKHPQSDDLLLIESGGSFYKARVADFVPPFTVMPPIDLSDVSDNVYLSQGQAAYKRFASATYVDIPISIADGGVYRLAFFYEYPPPSPNNTFNFLLPNYVGAANAFSYAISGWDRGTASGLLCSRGISNFVAIVYTRPNFAGMVSYSEYYSGGYYLAAIASRFTGGVLNWTTFGRITLPVTGSGLVYIRREA